MFFFVIFALFPLYKFIKYIDDMTEILLQITNPTAEASYFAHTKALKTWCHNRKLEINVCKIKEFYKTRPDNISSSCLTLLYCLYSILFYTNNK